MLSAADPLPVRPRRVLVAGVTGVGKSTLAQRIGGLSGIRYTEIDALYHGPDWTVLPTFSADVDTLAGADSWITEWQYRSARDRLARSADTLIWLDYSLVVTMWRLVRRTLRRRIGRQRLWNGNVEAPLWHFFTGRDHILAWALSTRHSYAELVPRAERENPGLRVVRLRTPAETRAWLTTTFGA